MLDLVTALALVGFAIEIEGGKMRFPKESPHLYLLVGLWVASVMSHVANTYFDGMMATIPLVFKSCLFSALLLCVLDRTDRLRVLAWLFVGMSAVMAVHAILQDTRGYGFGWETPILVRPEGGEAYTRSFFFGIFGDPNDLAQILVTSIPLCFVLTRRRSFISVLFGMAVAALLVTAIFSTHSRGGMVALAMVAAFMFVLILPARWLPILLTGLVIGALALCPLAAGRMDESAHNRVVFWGQANWVFKTHPLFGVGATMFSEYIEGDAAAHNAFVLCYTELGVFGYWFWFALIQISIIGAWRSRVALSGARDAEQAWLRRFSGAAIAAIVGYLASSYFLGRAFLYPMYFLFATLGAIPLVARKYLPEDAPSLVRYGSDLFVWCTLGAMLSIIYIYASIVLLNKAYYG